MARFRCRRSRMMRCCCESRRPGSIAAHGICSRGNPDPSLVWRSDCAGHACQSLGRDVAGAIVARGGSAAQQFNVGDSVFGVATGSFAEYAKAKERKLARTPDGLSAVEAAVLGISGMTALQAIDAAQVRRESAVLVIGASGGVGSYAVQIAHGLGVHVTGISRAAKADFVRSLGADQVIAYDRDGNNNKAAPTTQSSTRAETRPSQSFAPCWRRAGRS